MAGHPARNRSVRCAASQSGRAIYEISRRGSPTAITNATSITAKFPFLHPKIMRWHHDKPDVLGCSCNSAYIACNLGDGTASDLRTGILCAVLPQRELSE